MTEKARRGRVGLWDPKAQKKDKLEQGFSITL
jgi:hypothetical protein